VLRCDHPLEIVVVVLGQWPSTGCASQSSPTRMAEDRQAPAATCRKWLTLALVRALDRDDGTSLPAFRSSLPPELDVHRTMSSGHLIRADEGGGAGGRTSVGSVATRQGSRYDYVPAKSLRALQDEWPHVSVRHPSGFRVLLMILVMLMLLVLVVCRSSCVQTAQLPRRTPLGAQLAHRPPGNRGLASADLCTEA
jgi:hypothetical protein